MPSGIQLNNQEFTELFKQLHPNLSLIESYTTMKAMIKVMDKDGIVYSSRAQDLLIKTNVTIQSAIDKNMAFKIKSIAIHKDKYSYEKLLYVNARTNVTLTCVIHGDFSCYPDAHLNRNHGCPKCGKSSSCNTRKDNPVGWNISSWERRIESKKFFAFQLYVLRCWNEDEVFYKIGRTSRMIKKRFEDKNCMPYKWDLLFVYEDTAKRIYNIESYLKTYFKPYKYIPTISFNGKHECFININLNFIKMYTNV